MDNKHPYDELIEKVADKIKEYENDGLGYEIFEQVDKDLGLGDGLHGMLVGGKITVILVLVMFDCRTQNLEITMTKILH